MFKKSITRRRFLRDTGTVVSVITFAGAQANTVAPEDIPAANQIVAAIGDTLIPSEAEDPGYTDLEKFGITDEVMKQLRGLSAGNYVAFNNASQNRFNEKTFMELAETERSEFLTLIIDKSLPETDQIQCEMVYNLVRTAVFTNYYQNFPEKVQRDANDLPVIKAGDQHQIINPNTSELVTGWDQAGFRGPWTWEEEENRRSELRALAQQTSDDYHRFED